MISNQYIPAVEKATALFGTLIYDRSYENLSWPDFCRQLCQRHDSMFDVPDSRRVDTGISDQSMVRTAISNAAIVETFSTVVGNKLAMTAATEPDTTKDWVYESSAPNFLPATFFTPEHGARLERLAKGQTAIHTSLGTKGEPYGIARYAGQFVVDETAMLDGQHVGAVLLAPTMHAAAAARLRADLVYSLLLSNPTLTADNVALFNSSHGNYGTGGGSALSATSLDTGISAIGLQYMVSEQDSKPVHGNLQARYCIVPPQLVGAGRRAVRNMVLGDGQDLTVRQDSRLSQIGVVDPRSGTTYSGTATNWLLTAPSGSSPSVVVAGLEGNSRPQFRKFELTNGQWGMGWDVLCDIGAAVLDYRGLYFSAGA